jgi:hypothetical protein
MQADIKDALSGKYGNKFPDWTVPFLHAVGILDDLKGPEASVIAKGEAEDAESKVPRDIQQEVSKGSKQTEKDAKIRREDAEASLISVSRCCCLQRNCSSDSLR